MPLYLDQNGSKLVTEDRKISYPIIAGIPRFVSAVNYAEGFGEEWKKFGQIQFDNFSGNLLSTFRFAETTSWSEECISNKVVLDAGCGAGRHSEPAIKLNPSKLVCVDISEAIDVHQANFLQIPNNERIIRAQASINQLPFPDNYFDSVFCMGVIQHTPNPLETFKELIRVLKPGGRFVVDTYMHGWRMYSHLQFIFWRPLFKLLGQKRGKSFIDHVAPLFFPIHRAAMDIPVFNSIFWKIFPFDSKFPNLMLNREEEIKWFLMSIYDGYLSEYIFPQSLRSLTEWCLLCKVVNYEVVEQSFGDAAPLVVRGIKP